MVLAATLGAVCAAAIALCPEGILRLYGVAFPALMAPAKVWEECVEC